MPVATGKARGNLQLGRSIDGSRRAASLPGAGKGTDAVGAGPSLAADAVAGLCPAALERYRPVPVGLVACLIAGAIDRHQALRCQVSAASHRQTRNGDRVF